MREKYIIIVKFHNPLKFFFLKQGEYRRFLKTSCHTGYSKIYQSLEDAKTACSSDRNCIAIQDEGCNSKDLRLCAKEFRIRDSCHFTGCSCGYKKENLHSMLI